MGRIRQIAQERHSARELRDRRAAAGGEGCSLVPLGRNRSTLQQSSQIFRLPFQLLNLLGKDGIVDIWRLNERHRGGGGAIGEREDSDRENAQFFAGGTHPHIDHTPFSVRIKGDEEFFVRRDHFVIAVDNLYFASEPGRPFREVPDLVDEREDFGAGSVDDGRHCLGLHRCPP